MGAAGGALGLGVEDPAGGAEGEAGGAALGGGTGVPGEPPVLGVGADGRELGLGTAPGCPVGIPGAGGGAKYALLKSGCTPALIESTLVLIFCCDKLREISSRTWSRGMVCFSSTFQIVKPAGPDSTLVTSPGFKAKMSCSSAGGNKPRFRLPKSVLPGGLVRPSES